MSFLRSRTHLRLSNLSFNQVHGAPVIQQAIMADPADPSPVAELEYISESALEHLHPNQKVIFAEQFQSEIEALRNWAKDPDHQVGYANDGIPPLVRRILQAYQYIWETEARVIELAPADADRFVNALKNDAITQRNGEAYASGSKRKFVNALEAHFRVRDVEWTPPTKFTDDHPRLDSDPFARDERRLLKEASYNYRSPPSYSNVTPKERDRWNAYLAQILGKKKSEIGPDDWEELKQSWKFPSMIHFAFDTGSRVALMNSILTSHFYPSSEQVVISSEIAVKNNSEWEISLTSETVNIMERWMEERSRKSKYSDSDHMWLNRNGNPYDSGPLNNLIGNLMDDAGIEQAGRKLTWHSIRHSTGMYVYDETQDLGMVAEMLRLESLDAARIYAHPTPESQKNVLESIDRNP
jgi:integrase